MPGFEDFDIYGREHTDGTPFYFHDDDALNNALIGWLSSKRGDYVRFPAEGGILDQFLFKDMSDSTLSRLQFMITNAIINKFSGQIALNRLLIEPVRSTQSLQISIYYTSLLTGKANLVELYIDAFPDITYYKYQDVEYIEDNLYNFAELKKPSMTGRKLLYKIEQESWVWGKYRLVNLTTSDPRFGDILALINT